MRYELVTPCKCTVQFVRNGFVETPFVSQFHYKGPAPSPPPGGNQANTNRQGGLVLTCSVRPTFLILARIEGESGPAKEFIF
jgi:hypothetical protein